MALQARTAGTCVRCNSPIEIGQYISWPRTKGSKGPQGVYHVDCGNVAAIPEPSNEPIEVEETQPMHTNSPDVQAALATLLGALAPKPVAPAIDMEVIRAFVAECVANVGTVRVEVKQVEKPTLTLNGNFHKMFKALCEYAAMGQHVYLYGPAGTGKSTAAHQVAKALDRTYGYIALSPQTPESRLLGYMDATGNYVRTTFRDCYENGGVFCMDENDFAGTGLCMMLNGAFENGCMSFPDKIVERHKDFVCIATGNTCGRGANPQYPDRRPFDAAYAARFLFLSWDCDEVLEKKVALDINPDATKWVNWMVGLRKWADSTKSRLIVSPRETYRIARDLKHGMSPDVFLNGYLWHGDTELEKKALAACPLPN